MRDIKQDATATRAVNNVAAVNGTSLPGHCEWPWVGSGVVVTHRLVAQEVYNVGMAIGSSQVQRGALVVVTGVWGHAIVDEQLHVGCITIHTRLEKRSCSIHRLTLEQHQLDNALQWPLCSNTCHDCSTSLFLII